MEDSELVGKIKERANDPQRRNDFSEDFETPLFPPATMDSIRLVEERISFELGGFLSRLYTEVANGGFGPGYGLYGIDSGYKDLDGRDIADLYLHLSSVYTNKKKYPWREGLLPLCSWGSEIFTCVKAPSKEGAICTLHDGGLSVMAYDLRGWVSAWVEGQNLWEQMFERRVISVPTPLAKEIVDITVRGKALGRKWRKSR